MYTVQGENQLIQEELARIEGEKALLAEETMWVKVDKGVVEANIDLPGRVSWLGGCAGAIEKEHKRI